MRVIWKYPLPLSTSLATGVEVWVPDGGVIVHVGMQFENVTLWIEINTDAPRVSRHFCVVGTGSEIPPKADRYVGTVVASGFVFHVYEMVSD